MLLVLGLPLVFAPCQEAGARHAPSRFLPEERTVFRIEIPQPAALIEHRARIFQVGVFDLPRVRQFVEWLDTRGKEGTGLLARKDRFVQWLGAFDRGLTAASLYPKGTEKEAFPPEPWCCLVGAASKAAALRQHKALMLSGLERPSPLAVVERPVLDSPVPVRWLHKKADWDLDWTKEPEGKEEQSYVNDCSIFDAYKGRTAAVVFQSYYMPRTSPRQAVPLVAECLGMTPDCREGRAPAIAVPSREGWTTLARTRYRPKAFLSVLDPEKKGGGFLAPAASGAFASVIGVHVIDQVVSAVRTDGERVEEDIRVELTAGRKSVFSGLRYGGPALGDVASMLPADTIAALRLGVRGEVWSDLVYDLVENTGGATEEVGPFFGHLRTLLALGPQPEKEGGRIGLEGLREVVAFVVPGAAGSPVPEPGLIVPARGEDAARAMLEEAAVLLASHAARDLSPADAKKKIRTLGKGGGVRFLRYADFYGDRSSGMLLRFLGGGFLAATRIGDRLAIGCNPRTLRRMREAATQGPNLAGVEGFRAAFPPGSGRAVELWADTAALADSLRKYDNFLPLLHLAGGEQVSLPRIQDLRPLLGRETLWSTKTAKGHAFLHRGGTFLSPTAWATVGYAIYMLGVVAEVIDR